MDKQYVPTFEEYSSLIKSKVVFSNLQDRNPEIWIKTLDHGAHMIPLDMKKSVAAKVSRTAMEKIGKLYDKAMHDKQTKSPDEKVPDISYDAYFDQTEFQSLKDAAFASTQPEPETVFRRNLRKEDSKTKF